jgi:hypothetical protein
MLVSMMAMGTVDRGGKVCAVEDVSVSWVVWGCKWYLRYLKAISSIQIVPAPCFWVKLMLRV